MNILTPIMKIPLEYLNRPYATNYYGPLGQVFLYEWSKLRYGVYEEHGYLGDPLYPMFYSKQIPTENGPISVYKPTICSNVEAEGCI